MSAIVRGLEEVLEECCDVPPPPPPPPLRRSVSVSMRATRQQNDAPLYVSQHVRSLSVRTCAACQPLYSMRAAAQMHVSHSISVPRALHVSHSLSVCGAKVVGGGRAVAAFSFFFNLVF